MQFALFQSAPTLASDEARHVLATMGADKPSTKMWRKVAKGLDSIPLNMVPEWLLREYCTLVTYAIQHFDDRLYLIHRLLPACLLLSPKRVLFIGVRPYTLQYVRLFESHGCEFWSIDRDPCTRRIAPAERHIVADIVQEWEQNRHLTFDLICCNGVLGWGVDSDADKISAFMYMRNRLSKGGKLLIGWNSDRCRDPLTLPVINEHFRLSPELSTFTHVCFTSSTHCFDLLEKRS